MGLSPTVPCGRRGPFPDMDMFHDDDHRGLTDIGACWRQPTKLVFWVREDICMESRLRTKVNVLHGPLHLEELSVGSRFTSLATSGA